jgi:hypothetical protein
MQQKRPDYFGAFLFILLLGLLITLLILLLVQQELHRL